METPKAPAVPQDEHIEQPLFNMSNMPNIAQPKFIEALNFMNEVGNVRNLELDLPILLKKVIIKPMEGIDDTHLKTLYTSGTQFIRNFNIIIFRNLRNENGELMFRTVDEMNSKLTEYDKSMIVFGLLASSFDKLQERASVCPECGEKQIHEFIPEEMFHPEEMVIWDKRIDPLDYEIKKELHSDENTKVNITFKIPTEKDKIELFSISKINTRKIEDNKGLVFTTLEYIIQYIKSIEFVSKTKNIILTDLTSEIYPFVAGSNLMMQDKIMKSMPEDEFLKYQPKFYYNVVCKNPNCNHEYKYNIGNVEDEFFRKTLSLYR